VPTAFFPGGMRFRVRSWFTASILLLIIHTAIILNLGRIQSAYSEVSYFVLLVLACGVATANAIRAGQAIRLFWFFLALAFALWAVLPVLWLYDGVVKGKNPDFLLETSPSFLHIVLMIAAAATRPHLRLAKRRAYRATFNFLVLLFVWVFAYAYLLFPYDYVPQLSSMVLRFEAFYFTENFLLLVVLGVLISRSHLPWKSIYWHLLGASAVYTLGSLITNVRWALGYPTSGGWTGPFFTAAICWFVGIGLRGWRQAPELAQTVQLDTTNTRYSSALAMLAVLAIPIVGVWELFRTDEPFGTHEMRLLIVMVAGLLLAIAVFVQDYLANREFSSDVGVAHDRLRLAMDSGKSHGWDWDLVSGQSLWFGDLQTTFGIESDTYLASGQHFYHNVHPEDRERVSRTMAQAIEDQRPYTAEFRIVRRDGGVRWVAARGKFYYSRKGEAERMLGMAVDITERKMAEEALASLSGRLIDAQEEERKRIARELHDDYNQRLAMLAIELEGLAENDGGAPAPEGQSLRQLSDRVCELGADLHSLSHRLHPSTLRVLGLVAAVKTLCEEFEEQQGVQVEFADKNVPRDIPEDAQLCLFRIAQEGLRNIKRHSGADRAEVHLEWLDQRLHLEVADRGRGFDPKKPAGYGIGLRSMEERLRVLGGRLEIHSRPMEGTRIDAWLPLPIDGRRAA